MTVWFSLNGWVRLLFRIFKININITLGKKPFHLNWKIPNIQGYYIFDLDWILKFLLLIKTKSALYCVFILNVIFKYALWTIFFDIDIILYFYYCH